MVSRHGRTQQQRRLARQILVSAMCLSTILLSGSQVSANASSTVEAPETTPPKARPAPAPNGGSSVLRQEVTPAMGTTETAQTSSVSAAGCTYYAEGDYVHVSSTAFEASGHGWWVNQGCPVTHAVVTVQLQEYYNDGSWRNKGVKGSGTVASGGGSTRRVTGRAACSNGLSTGWRSVIVVDLVNYNDVPSRLITPSRNIGCRVY